MCKRTQNKLKRHTRPSVFFSHILCLQMYKNQNLTSSPSKHTLTSATGTATSGGANGRSRGPYLPFDPHDLLCASVQILRAPPPGGASPVHVGGAISGEHGGSFSSSHEQTLIKKRRRFKCQNQSGSSGPKSLSPESVQCSVQCSSSTSRTRCRTPAGSAPLSGSGRPCGRRCCPSPSRAAAAWVRTRWPRSGRSCGWPLRAQPPCRRKRR